MRMEQDAGFRAADWLLVARCCFADSMRKAEQQARAGSDRRTDGMVDGSRNKCRKIEKQKSRQRFVVQKASRSF